MSERELRHPHGVTGVFTGERALAEAGERLSRWVDDRRLFVVTTPRVWALHGAALESLRAPAAASEILTVPEGESAKTIGEAERLWRTLSRHHGKRDSRLVAFGGGSVGDLGGFVAGCFVRGIEYAQLPTTVLAQVDASIGGKTAVDLPTAKNVVGLFHHPRWVVAQRDWLRTLPHSEVRAGLAEVVKIAAIRDEQLFAALERDIDELLAAEPEALGRAVEGAVAAKIAVVEADPDETRGVRQLLNFGHTLGHALEAASGYRQLRHGEAVAHGMRFALRLAERRGLDAAAARRLRAVIDRLPAPPLTGIAADAVRTAMGRDKKRCEDAVRWVLPTGVGAGTVVSDVSEREVRAELDRFLGGDGV